MSDLNTPEPKHHGVDILRDPRLNKMTCFSERTIAAEVTAPAGLDKLNQAIAKRIAALGRSRNLWTGVN